MAFQLWPHTLSHTLCGLQYSLSVLSGAGGMVPISLVAIICLIVVVSLVALCCSLRLGFQWNEFAWPSFPTVWLRSALRCAPRLMLIYCSRTRTAACPRRTPSLAALAHSRMSSRATLPPFLQAVHRAGPRASPCCGAAHAARRSDRPSRHPSTRCLSRWCHSSGGQRRSQCDSGRARERCGWATAYPCDRAYGK